MIGALKALFETPANEDPGQREQRIRLAAAALLIETARADFTQDAAEQAALERLLTQKLQLIDSMWSVAFADGNLDKYEEHLIRQVAELTYVPHPDYIRSKLAAQG